MRKLIPVLILALSALAHGQIFEGKVVYENSFKSRIAGFTDGQLAAQFGTQQDYYIRQGSYKTWSNGVFAQQSLYVNTENRLYFRHQGAATFYWIDAGTAPISIVKSEIKKDVLEILGYKCDELTITTKDGVKKYYFNANLALNPALYKKHSLEHWYEIITLTRSVPLKFILETPQYVITSVAREITPMTLDEKEFELPKDAKIEKSPN